MDLIDLKEGDCRYPSGDALPFDFCGAPIVEGSYCAQHHKLCVSSKTPKDWRGLAGMIYSTEQTITHASPGSFQTGRIGYRRESQVVHPIDEVFAASAECIGDGLLMDRVL